MMPKFLLTHSTRGVDFIAKDQERNLREFFDREKCVEFGLGFSEAFKVSAINEKNDSVDFREVVAPEATG